MADPFVRFTLKKILHQVETATTTESCICWAGSNISLVHFDLKIAKVKGKDDAFFQPKK